MVFSLRGFPLFYSRINNIFARRRAGDQRTSSVAFRNEWRVSRLLFGLCLYVGQLSDSLLTAAQQQLYTRESCSEDHTFSAADDDVAVELQPGV